MAKALKTVATIAGAVALVATGVGAVAGGALAATAASVGTYAGLAAGVAGIGANLLAKKPPARGNVNNVLIATDAPAPCIVGRTFFGGVLRHDVGYGGTVDDVQNPYRAMVLVYSVGGPVESFEGFYADFENVPLSGSAATGYYADYCWVDSQLGATPEATALSAHFSGMPNWGSAYKLSGKAALLCNFRFDKDGKRFAAGLPALGAVWRGVKCYDPRLDSSYPGGAGSHSLDDPASWEWSENPGLHALMYAVGRYENGRKVFGVGMGTDGLEMADFVNFANVCDANGWKVGGVIFESGGNPSERWANLVDICAAGGAVPLFRGGKLGLRVTAPRVAIATVTDSDLADGVVEFPRMKSWRDRRNILVPKYRSEAHNWEYVQADAVSFAAHVTADGEEKLEERQFNLVQDVDQATQLCGYELLDMREIGPIVLSCKAHMRFYKPGDMLSLSLRGGLIALDAVIEQRSVNPATMTVDFVLNGETASKHAQALALTGTAPPVPSTSSLADRDAAFWRNRLPRGYDTTLIGQSYMEGASISGSDVGSTATVTVAAHDRIYPDRSVAIAELSVTGLAFATTYSLYYDDPERLGDSLTLVATTNSDEAFASADHPYRHNVGAITTPADGGPDTSGYVTLPPNWNYYFPV